MLRLPGFEPAIAESTIGEFYGIAESNSRALFIKANFHGIAKSNSRARLARFVCFGFYSAQNITSEQFKIGTQGPTIFDS